MAAQAGLVGYVGDEQAAVEKQFGPAVHDAWLNREAHALGTDWNAKINIILAADYLGQEPVVTQHCNAILDACFTYTQPLYRDVDEGTAMGVLATVHRLDEMRGGVRKALARHLKMQIRSLDLQDMPGHTRAALFMAVAVGSEADWVAAHIADYIIKKMCDLGFNITEVVYSTPIQADETSARIKMIRNAFSGWSLEGRAHPILPTELTDNLKALLQQRTEALLDSNAIEVRSALIYVPLVVDLTKHAKSYFEGRDVDLQGIQSDLFYVERKMKFLLQQTDVNTFLVTKEFLTPIETNRCDAVPIRSTGVLQTDFAHCTCHATR